MKPLFLYSNIFLICFFSPLLNANFNADLNLTKLERLDPHGNSERTPLQPTRKECSVCHELVENKYILKPNTEKTCILCHNSSPHSGVLDHIGKKTTDNKLITCFSCHTAHRWDSKNWEVPGSFWRPQKIHAPLDSINPDSLWSENHKQNSLMKQTCSDCHKW
ncbi:MAG TPA: hypothetical protein PLJ21_04375 [Pseudobdellovibrionaceae bacterium]|nr:hypothetical protein [Pseudobdellovibrionaceae bacterium]